MSTVTRWLAHFQTQSVNDERIVNFPRRSEDPGGIDQHSGVFATVTQVDRPDGTPFIGQASISVRNIAPQDDGTVHIWLAVSPVFFNLNVRIQFLVCND